MVAQVPDRRTGRLVGAAAIALLLVGLTLLLEPAEGRASAAALLLVGLVAGVLVAMRLPASGRLRTPMERLNDAAFLVVVAAVSLVAVRLARPWTAVLPGLVGGALIGFTLRPAPTNPEPPGVSPGHSETPRADPDPGHAGTPPPDPDPGHPGTPRADPDPGHPGTPPPDAEPPGGGR
jgi:hypothetical protein